MLTSLVLLVFLYFCDVEPFMTADELEFWTRYPETVARRAYVQDKYKNFTSNDDKTQFRYKKMTKDRKSNRTAHTSHSVDRAKLKSTTKVHYRAKSRSQTDDDSDLDPKKENYWPKVQQHRFRKRDRDVIRSTRMTPIYLMQQEDEATDKVTLSPDEDRRISPYSIHQDMLDLTQKFPEANITVEVIGRTAEYNDIVMLKVAERKSELGKYFRADESKYIDEVPEKKIIFIVHGLSVMGMSLLPCLGDIPQFKELLSFYFAHLDKFDIFLIPLANPDGFAHRKELWNKNVSPQGACSGVALDRNFDVGWNISHTISSCSQHYPGPSAFSEPETRAIRDVLHHYSHKINGYFHVHAGSYVYTSFKGDAVLYPKGFTDVQSDDDKYIDLRGEIDEAMKNASFQVLSVTVDTLHNWYGKVTGSSVDYASSIYGVPYALELVMQPYEDLGDASSNDKISSSALREIWKRVIDVIFLNIWRNAKNNDVV